MTFNGLITTAGAPQWPEGPGPRQLLSRERPRTSHKRTRGPSSVGRERPGPPGPAAPGRLGTAGRKQSGGEEPRGYSSAVCTGSARAGRAGSGAAAPEPEPRRAMGACEGDAGSERDAGPAPAAQASLGRLKEPF